MASSVKVGGFPLVLPLSNLFFMLIQDLKGRKFSWLLGETVILKKPCAIIVW
jgi:hypothetical protein